MRPQAGVDRLKPVPPMHANDLPLVAQAVSPAYRIFSQLLTVAPLTGGATVRERLVPCPGGDVVGGFDTNRTSCTVLLLSAKKTQGIRFARPYKMYGLDRPGGLSYWSLMPRASMVWAVARSRLARASAKSAWARTSRLRAAIRSVWRCSTRKTLDVPAWNWRCSLAFCSSADWRARPDASRRARLEFTACKALRTSASTAMPTWFSTKCRRRPSAAAMAAWDCAVRLRMGSDICTPTWAVGKLPCARLLSDCP